MIAPIGLSDGSANALYTVSYVEVAPSQAAAVSQTLKAWSDDRRSPQLQSLEILRRTQPSHHFAIIGSWERSNAESVVAPEPLQSLADQLSEHLIAGIDTRLHSGLIMGPDRNRETGTVFILTHIDVPPPNKDACIALLREQIGTARRHPGNTSFEVLQQADRPNHFSVLESWRSADSYQSHIIAEHTRAFRKKLTPLSGALYDERVFSTVV